MPLRFTLQSGPEAAEVEIMDYKSEDLSASVIAKIATAISGDASFGERGYVRVYNGADICVLTASARYAQAGFIPFGGLRELRPY